MAEEKKPSNVVLIKKFFGTKDGQKLTDFMEELKELTTEDKEQLGSGIADESLNY